MQYYRFIIHFYLVFWRCYWVIINWFRSMCVCDILTIKFSYKFTINIRIQVRINLFTIDSIINLLFWCCLITICSQTPNFNNKITILISLIIAIPKIIFLKTAHTIAIILGNLIIFLNCYSTTIIINIIKIFIDVTFWTWTTLD